MVQKIKKTLAKKKSQTHVVSSDAVRDYSNEEFFIQKANATKTIIEKFGYPKGIKLKG